MASIRDIIVQAAQRRGVDPNALLAVAQIESSLNPNAKNPNSSAGGLFQFIDGTARQYGLTNKFDPAANADAGARLMADNMSFLRSRGLPVTPASLYMAHQQGAGGAAKILQNPTMPLSALVGPAAAKLNGGADMSASNFYNMFGNKVDRAMSMPAGTEGGAPVANGINTSFAGQMAPTVQPTVVQVDEGPSLAQILKGDFSSGKSELGDMMKAAAGIGAGDASAQQDGSVSVPAPVRGEELAAPPIQGPASFLPQASAAMTGREALDAFVRDALARKQAVAARRQGPATASM